MSEKNVVTKDYLSDPERFAQMFNAAMFHEHPVIEPTRLSELDPSKTVTLHPHTEDGVNHPGTSSKERFTKETYRDILKIYNNRALMMICGIENQDKIHYAMPVRHMLYDALQYHDQWREYKHSHEKAKDLKGAEYLSGISKADRFIPVFTLCIYWGADPWDGPKNLQEMLDIPPELEQYRDKIGNYTLNILEVNAIDDLDLYHGELKALLGLLRYQKDKTALRTFVNDNLEIFQSMTSETVLAMSVLGNIKTLQKYIKEDKIKNTETRENEKGGIDVCQAIEEMINDGREEGILIGEERGEFRGGIRTLIEDNLEEGISEARILEKLQKRFELTAEDAAGYLEKYRK